MNVLPIETSYKEIKMKAAKLALIILVLNQISLPALARPGETIGNVLKKFNIEGQQPVNQGDYISYKVSDSKFISQPTVFFKIGANGIVLEENFLFDKNTIHEKDVQRAKSDSLPVVDIPHHVYLIGDYSQLPREQFDSRSKAIGAVAAPFGAFAGSVVGAGRGVIDGTKIGIGTANSASKALGGDASGTASAWASSAAAVATGAVTGLFGGLAGGVVEGSVRGARVGVNGVSGADRKIEGVTPADSNYAIIGGRIGKELTVDEQKALLDELAKLEQSRLAGGNLGDKDLADSDSDNDLSGANDKLAGLDSARDKSGMDNSNSDYVAEDAANKNVAGMW